MILNFDKYSKHLKNQVYDLLAYHLETHNEY